MKNVNYYISEEENILKNTQKCIDDKSARVLELEAEASALKDEIRSLKKSVGYSRHIVDLLKELKCRRESSSDGDKPIKWSKIKFKYFDGEPDILENVQYNTGFPLKPYNGEITRKAIIEALEKDREVIYVTEEMVELGFFLEKLGLEYLENGGYFAFWYEG